MISQPALELAGQFKDELNPNQWRAATHLDGPMLVIAGAGSGKTKTLVYRVAHLIQQGVDPSSILLLTFTKKSAYDMMRRASSIVGDRSQQVAGGTFHSVANMLLRVFAPTVGFDPGFTILDRSDADDLIGVIRGNWLSRLDVRFPKKSTIGSFISRAVNTGQSLESIIAEDSPSFLEMASDIRQIAIEYTERKRASQLMDYDDLLLFFREALENRLVADQISEQYRYIMIDEYQDTNAIQCDIIRMMGRHGNVMAVGDDAQSIYSFRGASIQHILDFPTHFPNTQVVTLDQNYRSTQPILDLTNAVISQSTHSHYTKVLFTNQDGGARPVYIEAMDERAQSQYVKTQVLAFREEGVSLNDMAVLIRSGYHSNDLEIELNASGIPFQKFGGFKFLETAHIKDVVAYLKVIQNPSDEISWSRVLGLLDGVGAKTISRIISNLDRLRSGETVGLHKKRCWDGLKQLLGVLETRDLPAKLLDRILVHYLPLMTIRYDDHHRRMGDIESLKPIVARFDSLPLLLSDLSLDPPELSQAGVLGGRSDDERLTISTIHSAKGLEWQVVFLISMVDGYLPSMQSLGSDDQVEEERRLLYVALTRAKRYLMILKPHMESGGRFGSGVALTEPCRFLTQSNLIAHYTNQVVLKKESRRHRQWVVPGSLDSPQPSRKKYYF